MRITALILSLYVCFLATVPALGIAQLFPHTVCCVEVCADEEEHEEEKEDDCREVCNPFLSCQCCLGFTSAAAAPALNFLSSQPVVRNSRLSPFCSSQVILPVWHPPKAICV